MLRLGQRTWLHVLLYPTQDCNSGYNTGNSTLSCKLRKMCY